MSIRHAILGFLSWTPLTGYDLKKLFADSPVLYWSGNNNQIYRTLIQLHEEKLVTTETQYQGSKPPRKIYTITEQGRAELRQWVCATPELPHLRSSFLVQLAWADQLDPGELDSLLARYEEELQTEWLMLRAREQRQPVAPRRTPREIYLWDMIAENWTSFYEHELYWVRKLRRELEAGK
jgi:DNA-binding PadR family transcriptional regulator